MKLGGFVNGIAESQFHGSAHLSEVSALQSVAIPAPFDDDDDAYGLPGTVNRSSCSVVLVVVAVAYN